MKRQTKPTCSVDECNRNVKARGFCDKHYLYKIRHRELLPREPIQTCSIDDCTRKHYARNMCSIHYHRVLKHGDPWAIHQGGRKGGSGVSRQKQMYDGKEFRLYRLIWEEHFGPIPDDYVIHHKNHDMHDNRIENLECLPREEHSREHSTKHPLHCKVEGCPSPTRPGGGHGWCHRHTWQMRKHGRILSVLPIPNGSWKKGLT